ncbi:hypothetical protein HanIR_Chr01g0027551 [Helianthus annuus]|nr:hypothetical protein HanIR_Chr01g0027551 [Helianthus annuus]
MVGLGLPLYCFLGRFLVDCLQEWFGFPVDCLGRVQVSLVEVKGGGGLVVS